MLTPEQAKELLDRGGVTLTDVGEEWQLCQGTNPGAGNSSRSQLEIKADTEEDFQGRQQKTILTHREEEPRSPRDGIYLIPLP